MPRTLSNSLKFRSPLVIISLPMSDMVLNPSFLAISFNSGVVAFFNNYMNGTSTNMLKTKPANTVRRIVFMDLSKLYYSGSLNEFSNAFMIG